MITNKTYSGRILRADLGIGTIINEQFDKSELKKYIGKMVWA